MIPSDLAARLRTLTEASFFDSDPPIQGPARVREIQARLPELAPGQQFTATLQRALPDGTFQAVVAGRSYTLALNHSAKPGDTLELVVTKSAAQTVFAQLANPAATANTAPSSGAALSATGRLISFLLTGQPAPQPAQLASGQPLTQAPPTQNGAQLAPALRQALAQSGMFYESHQAKWLSGKFDLTQLKQEPQGRQVQAGATGPLAGGAQPAPGMPPGMAPREGLLQTLFRATGIATAPAEPADDTAAAGTRPATTTASATPASPTTPGQTATPLARGASTANPGAAGMAAADDANGQRPADSQQNASSALRTPVIPERLLPIVHQQLDALGTQTYIWHGQAWPGQAVQWEIEDPTRERDEQGNEAPAQEWNTTLRLTLPTLGGIEARLHLTPAGVALRLMADDPETVEALQAAKARLDAALEAAALPLTGFLAEQRHDG